MADQLTDDQLNMLKTKFNTFDPDGTGIITRDQLADVLRSLEQDPTEEELDQFVQQLGSEDGNIHWDKFVELMAQTISALAGQ
ncbi:hypothetical protein TB1_037129 [Malus domestica]